MAADLPRPVTNEQRYLAMMCGLLTEQNALLQQVVRNGSVGVRAGRVDSEAKVPDEPAPVVLREPEVPPASVESNAPAEPVKQTSQRAPRGRVAKKGN